jgi:putative ABC transport system permease protein
MLGLTPETAIGQEISTNWAFEETNFVTGKIVGVVKDFPYLSVREKISPLVLSGAYRQTETMNVKIAGSNVVETIAAVERTWKNIYGGYPFQYWFMDDEFGKLYRQETQMARLSNYFTAFAIVIACLGLFGLAAFTAEQKTKEIGIRKVMGASATQILLLLTNKFVRLVLIACMVAVPLSLYAMNVWLESFAYRTTIDWIVFAGAGVSILVLTYLTVGIESLRAANANPVDSIRHE